MRTLINYALIQFMKKSYAIKLLGGKSRAARLIESTPQAITGWPDELPKRIADRVEAAYHRQENRKLPTTEELEKK